jgi:glycosyltransferase involved in cell wall biosynthesis/ubiquinone/menaquinone biosynthesis C-methylase UbiE
MKIAMIASTYPRYEGDGAARFNHSIAEALAGLGHEVHVVLPYTPAMRPFATPVHIHVFRYIWPNSLSMMGYAQAMESDRRMKKLAYVLAPPFFAGGGLKLWRVVRRHHVDLIHAHWVIPNGFIAAIVAKLTGRPLFISLHGSDIFFARRNPFLGALASWSFKQAAGVTACSPELYAGAVALGAAPRKLHLLPWGADATRFKPTAGNKVEALQAQFGLGPMARVVMGVGRLVGKKGFAYLIEALARLRDDFPNLLVMLVGDGPELTALRARAEALDVADRVLFAGNVAWSDIPHYLALADIFAMPSIHDNGNADGLPTVILEAMAAGKPIVASNVGGIALVVEEGRNGFLVAEGAPNALAAALGKLLRSDEMLAACGRRSRELVEQRLNWHNVARSFVEMYEGRVITLEVKVNMTEQKAVPATAYTDDYYTTCCDGYEAFRRTQGQELPPRLAVPLELLRARPGSLIVDIGCGRGELIYHLAKQGHRAVGLDYAVAGVRIAHDALSGLEDAGALKLAVNLANAKYLPFPDNAVDHLFMLDVVEHLFPRELQRVFREIHRVLRPGGTLIIHTMPNTWYYAAGYPLYRLVQRVRGARLPANPRERWAYYEVHVNEQNPLRLFGALRRAGFQTKVWLKSVQDYSYEPNRLVRGGMYFLTSAPLLKLIFCNDIFAVATKPE